MEKLYKMSTIKMTIDIFDNIFLVISGKSTERSFTIVLLRYIYTGPF